MIELDLVSPTARLIEDLGTMSAVAVLGFTASSAEQTSTALSQVAADARWAFVDIRDPKSNPSIDAPVLVVATGKAAIANMLGDRIRELVEKRPGLRQKLIVLCEGATRHAELPRELARAQYSEFLPAPSATGR